MVAAATRRCELLLGAARLNARERDDGAGEREERVREDGLPASAPSAAIAAGEARSGRRAVHTGSPRGALLTYYLLTAGAARRAPSSVIGSSRLRKPGVTRQASRLGEQPQQGERPLRNSRSSEVSAVFGPKAVAESERSFRRAKRSSRIGAGTRVG